MAASQPVDSRANANFLVAQYTATDLHQNAFPSVINTGGTIKARGMELESPKPTDTTTRNARIRRKRSKSKRKKYKLATGGFNNGEWSSGLAITGSNSISSTGEAVAASNALDANANERSRAQVVAMVWRGGRGAFAAASSDSKDFHGAKPICINPPCNASDAMAISLAQILKKRVIVPGKHGNCTIDKQHDHDASEMEKKETPLAVTTQITTEEPQHTELETDDAHGNVHTTEVTSGAAGSEGEHDLHATTDKDCEESISDDFQAPVPVKRCRKKRPVKKQNNAEIKQHENTTSNMTKHPVDMERTQPKKKTKPQTNKNCTTEVRDDYQAPVPLKRCKDAPSQPSTHEADNA